MNWELVVLMLGLCACGVAVYVVRVVVLGRSPEWKPERDAMLVSIEGLRQADAAHDKRLKAIESALHMDGQRIVAEAARRNLPAMMR